MQSQDVRQDVRTRGTKRQKRLKEIEKNMLVPKAWQTRRTDPNQKTQGEMRVGRKMGDTWRGCRQT